MSQPRVVVCERCREHGRIVFPDGAESREFWTKFGGFDVVADHHKKGSLTQPEALLLAKQVSGTGFPRTKQGISHASNMCPEFAQILRALVAERPPASAPAAAAIH